MRRIFLCIILLTSYVITTYSQVTTQPSFIEKSYKGEIKVIFNPNEGNKGMVNATQCYAHTGLITSKSSTNTDWKYAPEWRGGESKYKMTKEGDNWILTIPNIYTYFGCPESEEIIAIAFVFNDGPNGTKEGKTKDGSDILIFLTEPGLSIKFNNTKPPFINLHDSLLLDIVTSDSADIKLFINNIGHLETFSNNVKLNYIFNANGNYQFVATATKDTVSVSDNGDCRRYRTESDSR